MNQGLFHLCFCEFFFWRLESFLPSRACFTLKRLDCCLSPRLSPLKDDYCNSGLSVCWWVAVGHNYGDYCIFGITIGMGGSLVGFPFMWWLQANHHHWLDEAAFYSPQTYTRNQIITCSPDWLCFSLWLTLFFYLFWFPLLQVFLPAENVFGTFLLQVLLLHNFWRISSLTHLKNEIYTQRNYVIAF